MSLIFDKSLFLTSNLEVRLQVVRHVIEVPPLNRVRLAHRHAKASLFVQERSWHPGGPYAKTLCAFCGERNATEAHHLIYTRAMLRSVGVDAKVAAEHVYNLAAVCHKCHQEEPVGFRHALIVGKYRRYGRENILSWVAKFQECLTGVSPPMMPHTLCESCQNSRGGCPYGDACSGEYYLEMLCDECPYRFPDCAHCGVAGQQKKGVK
jgi:hypothetical protein